MKEKHFYFKKKHRERRTDAALRRSEAPACVNCAMRDGLALGAVQLLLLHRVTGDDTHANAAPPAPTPRARKHRESRGDPHGWPPEKCIPPSACTATPPPPREIIKQHYLSRMSAIVRSSVSVERKWELHLTTRQLWKQLLVHFTFNI